MNDLGKYLIESSLSLCLFYGIYWIFLRKDTFFKRNRFYLALTIILSMVLPLMDLSIRQPSPIYSIDIMLDEAVIIPATYGYVIHSGLTLQEVLKWFYWGGVLLFSLKFLFHTGQIIWLIYTHGIRRENGLRLVYLEKDISPFSFYNIIFLNKSMMRSAHRDKIIAHEMNHIRNRHTLDLAIFELLTIIQWFNPVAWLYKWSLKEIHEFQADEAVIREGCNSLTYQELIISQVFGNHFFRLTHNLNRSLIKKRILMMTKFKSSKISGTKILLVIPVAFFITALFSFSGNSYQQLNSSNPSTSNETFKTEIQDTTVYFEVDEMPDFQGKGHEGFREYIANNLQYPEEARENNQEGKVFVQFVVDREGYVVRTKVLMVTTLGESVDARKINAPLLVEEALRVMNSSPRWKPGKEKGKPVNVQYVFPIVFDLSGKALSERAVSERSVPSFDPDRPGVYFLVEEMPKFRGGDAGAFRKYIAENLNYPPEAAKWGISGRVFVQFIVNQEGKVEHVNIVRGVDPLLDKEAIRVVSGSPSWEPGKQDGKKVKVEYTFPIIFVLDEKKEEKLPEKDDTELEEQVFYIVEEMPKFRGSDDRSEFRKYIAENLVYPEEALKKGLSARVIFHFVVDKEGNVRDVRMDEKGIPEFEKEGIRVIQSSPKWEPGVQRGVKVNVAFTMPIVFLLPADWEKQPLPANIVDFDEEVFYVVEEMPKFRGGDAQAFRKYIAENLEYPPEAAKWGISGQVFVQFIVNHEGKVEHVKVVQGVDPILDKEAVRVVSGSPSWEPGKQRGKNVNVAYTFPIVFKLQENQEDKLREEKMRVEIKSHTNEEVLFLIDGKVVSYKEVRLLDPGDIKSLEVLKGEAAIEKYGESAKEGVILITLK